MRKFHLQDKLFMGMIGLYILVTLFATTQALVLKRKIVPGNTGPAYTKYNNYVIYQRSHFHLLEGKNLYAEYRAEQIDLYKYSPTFAFLFGSLAYLPDWLGLTLWNLLNILTFLFAVWLLPLPGLNRKALILLLSAPDVMNSLQNSQSNVLVAGLIICGFGLLEKKYYFLATLCILATFYIKIFGIIAILLFLLYPKRRKILGYTVLSFLLLGLLPLTAIGFDQLLTAYLQYFELLKMDQSVSYGLSVMGWLKAWFSLDLSKVFVVLAGFILLCLPLLRYRKFHEYGFRVMFLSAVMIWMLIFNHKAESSSFIIATSGFYILFMSARVRWADWLLLYLVVLFTSLSSTDLFPAVIREGIFADYVIKVVPCILIWGKILSDLCMERIGIRNA